MEDTYRSPDKLADVRDPCWTTAGKVHDWRNHVSEGVRTIWHTFTDEQVMALAADADQRAGNEEWD